MLMGTYCFARGEIDSLKKALENARHDTSRAIILNKLVEVLPEGEWEVYNDQMEIFSRERLATSKGDEKKFYLGILASAYGNKSISYKYKGQTALAVKYSEKALAIFKQLKDPMNLGTTSFNIGQLYFALGDINKAIESVQYALKMSEKAKKELVPYCLNYLGFISNEQKEYEKALEYHAAAFTKAKEEGDKEAIAYTLTCQGLVYVDIKQYDKALEAFKASLKLSEELNNDQNISSQYQNIGTVYQDQQRYAEAHENYMKSLEILLRYDYKMGTAATSNSIGQNYLLWGKEKEAETYLKKSLEIGQQLGFPIHIQTPAEGLYKIYKKRGDLKKALEMHELFIRMRDSINNEETRKTLLKSQYRYEYEKKTVADSIKSIEAEKIRVEKIEKERAIARTKQYALVAGIVVLLLSGFFLFQRFRLKQRLKELGIRNKIASDLHDEVGSALSSISLLSGMAVAQPNAQQQAVKKIEATSRETLENMGDIVWSIQPKNDKLADVVKRMKNYGQQLFSSLEIQFDFHVQGEVSDLPLNMEQRKNLYLIYKEALNNAAKYAQAKKITVIITHKAKHISLSVSDDGKGFDNKTKKDGNGLFTMQERAVRLNGLLSVKSNPEQGTNISLAFKTT